MLEPYNSIKNLITALSKNHSRYLVPEKTSEEVPRSLLSYINLQVVYPIS